MLKLRYLRLGTMCLALAILCALPAGASALVVHARGGQFFGVAPHKGIPPAAVPGSVAAGHASGHATTHAAPNAYWQNLNYQGGPVLHSSDPYVIFWGPSGDQVPADWQTLIERYFSDVAADSGRSTNAYAVARQFTDATGFADYQQTFAPASQAIQDAAPFPARDSANCSAGQSTTCLTDAQLQGEISSLIAANGLPADGPASGSQLPDHAPIYFVVLPSDVDVCLSDGSGTCASNDFCAYHSAYTDGSSTVLYATIPTLALASAQDAKSCQWDSNSLVQEPNGTLGDVALKYVSHEDNETITDPLGNAWWNAYTGNENGDNCNDSGTNANAFLPTLGGSADTGTLYDQLIAGDQYYLQSEWSNGDGGCEMKPSTATTTPRFSVPSGPRSPGTALTFSPATSSSTAAYSSETWNFGDGSTPSFHAGRRLTSASHTYASPGDYTVTLTLVDNRGNLSTTSEQISVGAAPTASLTASPTQLLEGSGPVNVDATASTDSGGAIIAYDWDFGDGTSAQGAAASHTYATAGTYLVRLTVTDSLGQVDTATTTATVSDEPPTAAFTMATQMPETGQPVSFDGSASHDPDGSITSYAWSFGDGSRASGPAPTHTYSNPGTYSVTLTVTDTGNQRSSTTQQLTVSRGPTAVLAVSPSQVLEGAPVSFDGSASAAGALAPTIQTYAWSFGDGSTTSGPTAGHTYAAAGTYTVSLAVTDSAGGRSTTTRSISVADEPPTAAFTTPSGILAVGQALTLDAGASAEPDGTINSYTWSFGDGYTTTGRSTSHTYASPGTYTVQLTVRDSAGVAATVVHRVTVHTQPQSTFTLSPALPREDTPAVFDGSGSVSSDVGTAIASYAWGFGDGASASGPTVTHTYTRAGTYMVTLSVTNTLGLTDTSTEQVTVAHAVPTAAIAVRPAEPARGRPVQFSGFSSRAPAGSYLSYLWRFGDGSSAVGRGPSHTYRRAGRYVVSLTVSDSFGDGATTTRAVTVTAHGLITSVAVRPSRGGATVLVAVNDAGTLTTAHRKLSIKRAGTAAIPIHLTPAQLRVLHQRHQVDLALTLRFAPRGGASKATRVVVSLRPAAPATGHFAAILIRRAG